MFFNVKGFYWVMGGILGVVLLCALDLHCSSRKDEGRSTGGALEYVKGEVEAGKQEIAFRREDSRNLMLRDLRIRARQLVKDGKSAEARDLILEIQKIENEGISKGRKSK